MHKQNGMRYAPTRKDDRGFYIILAICLAVIVTSGYVLLFAPGAADDPALDARVVTPQAAPSGGTAAVAVPDVDIPAQPQTAQTMQPEPEPQPAPEPQTEPTAAPEPAPPIWVRPVAGAVQRGFSGDTLLRDATMGDWRVHSGADYAASSGTRVYAASDGTVEAVETGTLYGTCVTLALADGKTMVYRGLSEKVKVKTGASVRAGDVIGTVGTDNAAEAAQASHLHVELYDGGAAIDPETVLGAQDAVDTSAAQDGIDVEE